MREKAEVLYALSLPIEATDWCESIGLDWQSIPTSEKFIVVWFSNLQRAKFYARRWNGRMGKEWVARQESQHA